jgi:hypothetical protein
MNRREYLRIMAAAAGALSLRSPLFAAEDIGSATHRTPVLAEYERLRFGVSYHFSMNTFTGNDYETGSAPASTYNPTHLDVRQWMRVARDLGALDITWKISPQQRWELYRLIKGYSPNCIIVMNQAYYQSKRNQGRICEPASWPTDVINGEDCLPPAGGHDPHIIFEGKQYYMPFESWIPTGPPFKPLPPMHSWFWRPGFEMQPAEVIAQAYRECMNRNANLLLNVSPDTTGQLPEQSVATLQQVAGMIRNYRPL